METNAPKTFSWYGEMERDLTRDQLCEVIRHLMGELEAAQRDVVRLRKLAFNIHG